MKCLVWFGLACALISSDRLMAEPELYAFECGDGVDNDFDGLVDCADPDCVSARDDVFAPCGFPSGPLVVGVGDSSPSFTFDLPAEPDPNLPPVASPVGLFIGDLDGPGPQRDDLVVSRSAGFSVFKNIVTPGYISIPASPTRQIGGSNSTFAVGDFNRDGRLDVVSASGTQLRLFRRQRSGNV